MTPAQIDAEVHVSPRVDDPRCAECGELRSRHAADNKGRLTCDPVWVAIRFREAT